MALTNRDARRRVHQIGQRLAQLEALAQAQSTDLANPTQSRMGSYSEDEPELHEANRSPPAPDPRADTE